MKFKVMCDDPTQDDEILHSQGIESREEAESVIDNAKKFDDRHNLKGRTYRIEEVRCE